MLLLNGMLRLHVQCSTCVIVPVVGLRLLKLGVLLLLLLLRHKLLLPRSSGQPHGPGYRFSIVWHLHVAVRCHAAHLIVARHVGICNWHVHVGRVLSVVVSLHRREG